MVVQLDILKSFSYCSGLSDAELDSIKHFFFEKAVGKGEIILLDGEPAEALYFVVSGIVKILKTSAEGKEQIITIVRPMQSFNDASVIDGSPNQISAQAMTPVVLYGMKNDSLKSVLHDYPKVAVNVSGVLSGQVRHLLLLIEDLSFKSVMSRVAKILLEPSNGTAPARLTQQDMAAMAGTAREMIGRSLKALESEGVIRMERHRIVIADKKGLSEIAGLAT